MDKSPFAAYYNFVVTALSPAAHFRIEPIMTNNTIGKMDEEIMHESA
jgi:hypothetical protein